MRTRVPLVLAFAGLLSACSTPSGNYPSLAPRPQESIDPRVPIPNEVHGGLELIESADVKSGEIVIQVVEGRSVAKLGWSYLATALKLRARHEAVREFRGRWFRIDTHPQMQVSIDGEVAASTPFEVRAIPDAVTIAVPRAA